MPSYTTRYLTKDEYKDWDALVLQSRMYSIFDTTLWLDTLSSVLKCDVKMLGIFNKEDLVGGVAFSVTGKFGIKIANTPQMSVYNSFHYIPRKTSHKGKQERYLYEIMTPIVERLQDDFHYAVITNHPEFKDIRSVKRRNWRENILYSYRICLSRVDISSISPSKRGWIKKARKNLITIEETKDVKSVYNIINDTYIRQNLKCPFTLDEMSKIFKKISNNIIILAAKEQETERYIAVYASLVDFKTNCVYVLFNGYDIEFAGSGANSLLIWEAIESFKDRGHIYFDIGGASLLSKASFKSDFFTELVPYYQVSKSNLLFTFLWHLTKGKIAQR